jgi:hypothetical protein
MRQRSSPHEKETPFRRGDTGIQAFLGRRMKGIGRGGKRICL